MLRSYRCDHATLNNMIMTPQLRSLLVQYKDMLSEEEFLSFEREVQRLLSYYMEMLAQLTPGAERGRRVHALINEQQDISSHIKVSCQKGCGACCHLEVEITKDDAMILAESLKTTSIDRERLRSLATRERLDIAWKQGMVPANRCVFLGADMACTNYENRPTVCRKLSVVSPVIECETVGGNPQPKVMPMAEIILSAAVNMPGNAFGSLAKMLNGVLEEQALAEMSFAESQHNLEDFI